ncbi:MAG: amidohydrolase family protein [bacterium]
MNTDNTKLSFCDVNVQVGSLAVPQPWHGDLSAKGIVDLLDRYGIDEALVAHTMSREGHPSRGNARIIEEVKDFERLHPCWVILPPDSPEMPGPDILLGEMHECGVCVARVIAKYAAGGVPLDIPWMGAWYKALSDHRVPLILDMNHTSPFYNEFPWSMINRICRNFPDLRLILLCVGYRTQRDLYAMLAQHKNLYVDLSFYCLNGGIQDLVERFGSNRFLFGSYLPYYSPGGPKLAITYGDLPFEDRANLAGANLRRLLSEAWT